VGDNPRQYAVIIVFELPMIFLSPLGKTVFLKFCAPSSVYCRMLKPDWEKLMDEFADSETALVADVDCSTAGGKPLCDYYNGVKGYPSLKYGDPSSRLEDYKGERDYNTLKKFFDENLKPMCSPANIALCDDEVRATIEKFQAMTPDELDLLTLASEDAMEEAETQFKASVKEIPPSKIHTGKEDELLAKIFTDKEEKLEEMKNTGLGLMKAVKAAAKPAVDSDEL
jgi:thiol-disulfide isomerase/thioredoxin